MAVKSSGALSMTELHAEFGGGYSLSNYYRGGTYVPNGPAANASIPLSGSGSPISFSQFFGSVRAFVFNQTIASNTTDYRLHNALVAAGWNQSTPIIATVTINSGIAVYESSVGSWAMIIGQNNNSTFPSGSSVTLINNGTIIGIGGNGGTNAVAGTAGGHALLVYTPVTVYNYGAIYAGGGGGGGGGQGHSYDYRQQIHYYYVGCGGGGGAALGSGGVQYAAPWVGVYWGGGQDASMLTAGMGGGPGTPGYGTLAAGGIPVRGGAGGLGTAGTAGNIAPSPTVAPGAGGAPGYYAYNNGYITWAVAGTRVGSVV